MGIKMGIKQEQKKNLSDSNSSLISLHMSTRVSKHHLCAKREVECQTSTPNPPKPNKTHQL